MSPPDPRRPQRAVPWADWSLRRKLVVACALVQLVAAVLVVVAGSRLLQRTLSDQADVETRRVLALLDQAIAAPLAQRDYATLQQTLDLARGNDAINYLVLRDHRGTVVATSGWDETQPLPPRDRGDIDLQRADVLLHLAAPITVAGQQLGRFDLGLSTVRLREARTRFLQHSMLVGTLALVASVLLLAAIAYAITRHLERLAQASQRVAAGDLDVHVPVTTGGEIGLLGASFNAMARALRQRVQALEKSEAQQTLHLNLALQEQSRLTTLLGAMPGGIVFVDAQARVVYANASFARIWSLPAIAGGLQFAELVPELVRQLEPADAAHVESIAAADAQAHVVGRELSTLDGRTIVQRMQPVASGVHGGGCIWFHDDVTLERRTQQRAHQAFHDPLTGLMNRRGLYEALQSTIANPARAGDLLSLLFIDLDDFKLANDVAGHRVGDEILVAVARALAGQVRSDGRVARLGGDEFAVMCPGIGASDAAALAKRLVQAVAVLRFPAFEQSLRVGCSIGVATYPADARTEDDLVACADAAMYEAKRCGKNAWVTYHQDPLRSQAESARVSWNARIHQALQEQRFVLHFQSVHRAADLGIAHYEALVRMVGEGDTGQVVSPGDFIPHAERSGLIRQIDRWVFDAAVAQLAATDASVCIAANLSVRSLEDASFPAFLRNLLQGQRVDPRRLHIELTETFAISDPMAARDRIDTLRRLGCPVHLDDFGSGFSSFAQLKLLDVDAIKIDGSFIRNLHADSSNRLFVSSMVGIAHELHKSVVAEQVEDAGTLEILRGLGVDLVQGFHLGRPSEQLADPRQRAHLQLVADFRRGAG